tara:strand:- start:1531 stop:6255 length:4725 start_codon:yes stop_codon:yes gene_type:complete
MNKDDISWKVIDMMFKKNGNFLVKHHIESYNNFFNKGLKEIFKNKNPIHFDREKDNFNLYKHNAKIYMGGRNADKIYYGKPVIYDRNEDGEEREHYMIPNEARLRNMSYCFTIHYDVEIDYKILLDNGSGDTNLREDGENKGIPKLYDVHRETVLLEKIYLGRFPIMLRSNLCILNGLNPEVRFNMGECRNDKGGYFIIDGKEKVIVSQEGRADNILYIRDSFNDLYSHSAEIRSVSEDSSKPIRTLSVRIVSPQPSMSNGNIVVNVPNVKKPVPLFILMRALGVLSDKEIITTCLLDLEKYSSYVELFRPSVHDAGYVFTQNTALKYIASLTKQKTIPTVLNILSDYFLPHIGELNFKHKSLYLGYIVKRLLDVYTNNDNKTDRDSYSYKRIEISGKLIYDLFREYYNKELDEIYLDIDKEYFYNENYTKYQGLEYKDVIGLHQQRIFSKRVVEQGFKKAFKGNWGASEHTKRLGLVQDLNRLSYFGTLCQLRKTNLHLSAEGAKVIQPRLLHSTQWGYLCPLHSPDGGNVGLHKHLSTSTIITKGESGLPYINLLRQLGVKFLEECSYDYLSKTTKVFINGAWIGATRTPVELKKILKLYKINNIINSYISVSFNIKRNEIILCTDAGRPCRPLYYVNDGQMSYQRKYIIDLINNDKVDFNDLMIGFGKNKSNEFNLVKKTEDTLKKEAGLFEYVDTLECEEALFPRTGMDFEKYMEAGITHEEIHPSLILGVMANQIIFPENNPYPRNAFSCGQAKQGVSLYHSNFQNRIDKSSFILNYAQVPLTKSRYLSYATNEQHGYGENAIVAVMCYSGFNVEDAVILNKGSLDRGLFRTTYYNMYESYEETNKIDNVNVKNVFMNIEENNVNGLKSGFDYSKLDKKTGLIRENEEVTEKTIVIGKASPSLDETNVYNDDSIVPKKGQTGVVDKSYMTSGDEGHRICKVRIRAERIPSIGDKFCSRAGQKGTIGIILDERDMPTTADGIKPDIIVNPHAMPSRMTIGHLVETITSKVASIYGGFGDCTAFTQNGPKHELFGKALINAGFHSSGNETLYNGMTGEQLESQIYFGPTYYLRLKHMPKDKINYRARGPRTVLTRQTVQGRANNGGLRVGEMDRDTILAHGMSSFMKESMLVRGDQYYMAVCNNTGTIAIYNEEKNLFISPFLDGPIQFTTDINNDLNIKNITKYGKSFSVVRVPYAFKLLMQELQAMNVQMRIITEDNIDQLTTLNKGDDLYKLTGLETLKEATKVIRSKQNKTQDRPDDIIENEKIKEEIKMDYEKGQEEGLIRYRSMLAIGDIVTFDMDSVDIPDMVEYPKNNYKVINIQGKYPNTILLLRGIDGESQGVLLDKIERRNLDLVKKWEPSVLDVGTQVRYKESYLYVIETRPNGKEEAEKMRGTYTVIDIQDLDDGEKEYIIQHDDENNQDTRVIKDSDLDVIIEKFRTPTLEAIENMKEFKPFEQEFSPVGLDEAPMSPQMPGVTPPEQKGVDPDSPPFNIADYPTPENIQIDTMPLEEFKIDTPELTEEEKKETVTIVGEREDTKGLDMLVTELDGEVGEGDEDEDGDSVKKGISII